VEVELNLLNQEIQVHLVLEIQEVMEQALGHQEAVRIIVQAVAEELVAVAEADQVVLVDKVAKADLMVFQDLQYSMQAVAEAVQ
jgi:hypothetical protein